jgi:hypothetical protein
VSVFEFVRSVPQGGAGWSSDLAGHPAMMVPSVRQEIRISCVIVVFEHAAASQATWSSKKRVLSAVARRRHRHDDHPMHRARYPRRTGLPASPACRSRAASDLHARRSGCVFAGFAEGVGLNPRGHSRALAVFKTASCSSLTSADVISGEYLGAYSPRADSREFCTAGSSARLLLAWL